MKNIIFSDILQPRLGKNMSIALFLNESQEKKQKERKKSSKVCSSMVKRLVLD